MFATLTLAGALSLVLFWVSASLYMLGFGILGPSATALTLDPVPDMAGRAAALLGTSQILAGVVCSLLAAYFYNGTVNTMVMMFSVCAVGTAWVAFRYRQN